MPENGLLDHAYDDMTSLQIYHKILDEADGDPMKALENHGVPFEEVIIDIGDPSEDQSNSGHVKQLISSAMEIVGEKDIGTGLGDLINSLGGILEPSVNWRNELVVEATSKTQDDFTFRRPNPLSSNGPIIFPSTEGDHISILFGSDSSGSMSQEDYQDAATELFSICEQFTSWDLTLGSCDTQFELLGEYSSEDGDDFTTMDIDFRGGGGTDMAPILEHIPEMEYEPDACIIITDGYIPTETLEQEAAEAPCPVIVVVTRQGNSSLELSNCKVIQIND